MATSISIYGFNLPAATVQGIQQVVGAMSDAGQIAGGGTAAGIVTYVDVTASRALLASDIGKVLRNTTGASLTITLAAGVGVVGNVFATKHSGAGTLLVTSGGGITAVDAGGLAASQATDAGAVMWEFDTATRVLGS